MQTIHKLPSRTNQQYERIASEIINNPNMTADALGVYAWLLNKPVDWKITVEGIRKRFKELSRERAYKAMKVLFECMVMTEEVVRNEQGHIAKRVKHLHSNPLPLDTDLRKQGKTPVKTKTKTKKRRLNAKSLDVRNQDVGLPVTGNQHKYSQQKVNTTDSTHNKKQASPKIDIKSQLNGSTEPIINDLAGWLYEGSLEGVMNPAGTPTAHDFETAKTILSSQIRAFGAEAIQRAHSAMIVKKAAGEVTAKPLKLFQAICSQQKNEIAKSKKRKVMRA